VFVFLQDSIDNLRRERQAFDNIYKKLEKDLNEKKTEMQRIIEISNVAFEVRMARHTHACVEQPRCSALLRYQTLPLRYTWHDLCMGKSTVTYIAHIAGTRQGAARNGDAQGLMYRRNYCNIHTHTHAHIAGTRQGAARNGDPQGLMLGKTTVTYIHIRMHTSQARDKAQQEMAMLKGQADREQASFESEWKELGKLIESDRKMKELLRQKEKAGIGSNGRVEDEDKLRKKIMRGNAAISKDKAAQQAALQKVQSYEEAFAKIQESTGISDIDELVRVCVCVCVHMCVCMCVLEL
jgi:hypothetical protein